VTLERYIFEEGSPFAKKLSDHILDIAEERIYDLIETASADINRDRLWSKFAVAYKPKDKRSSTICSLEEVKELISLSYVKPLEELDPRLMEMLTNEVDELELHLLDLIQVIIDDSRFHHYYLFEAQDDGNSTYLFYMDHVNAFLMLELDKSDGLGACTFIGRNGAKVEEESINSSFKEVVESVATLALSWMWDSS